MALSPNGYGSTSNFPEAAFKVVYARETLLEGIFPSNSPVTKSILMSKKNWDFNNQAEYRMLLTNSNTQGSLNRSTVSPQGGLLRPGEVEVGKFTMTYGTIMDSTNIDMFRQIESSPEGKKAFISDIALKANSLHKNVANGFKNFVMHGRFGELFQITTAQAAVAATPVAATSWSDADLNAVSFTLKVPSDVWASGFKKSQTLIKTTEPLVNGAASVAELYVVLDQQPKAIRLAAVPGSTPTTWEPGQFVQVDRNREPDYANGAVYQWLPNGNWGGSGFYTSGINAVTGGLEGIPDILAWHTDTAFNRVGLDIPFRGWANRRNFTTETAGGLYVQSASESIMDAVLQGVRYAQMATYSDDDLVVVINPDTLLKIGYQEQDSVRSIRENFTSGPIIYQSGVKTFDFQIGNRFIKHGMTDENLRTDRVLIMPRSALEYSTIDNFYFDLDEYIRGEYGDAPPANKNDMLISTEFATGLDLSKRIVFSSPSTTDGDLVNSFRHPKNSIDIKLYESGCLFTEQPKAFTTVVLRNQVIDPNDGQP